MAQIIKPKTFNVELTEKDLRVLAAAGDAALNVEPPPSPLLRIREYRERLQALTNYFGARHSFETREER